MMSIMDPSFACGMCGKCFKEAGQMMTHIQTHTGQKPFRCVICWPLFYDMSDDQAAEHGSMLHSLPFSAATPVKGSASSDVATTPLKGSASSDVATTPQSAVSVTETTTVQPDISPQSCASVSGLLPSSSSLAASPTATPVITATSQSAAVVKDTITVQTGLTPTQNYNGSSELSPSTVSATLAEKSSMQVAAGDTVKLLPSSPLSVAATPHADTSLKATDVTAADSTPLVFVNPPGVLPSCSPSLATAVNTTTQTVTDVTRVTHRYSTYSPHESNSLCSSFVPGKSIANSGRRKKGKPKRLEWEGSAIPLIAEKVSQVATAQSDCVHKSLSKEHFSGSGDHHKAPDSQPIVPITFLGDSNNNGCPQKDTSLREVGDSSHIECHQKDTDMAEVGDSSHIECHQKDTDMAEVGDSSHIECHQKDTDMAEVGDSSHIECHQKDTDMAEVGDSNHIECHQKDTDMAEVGDSSHIECHQKDTDMAEVGDSNHIECHQKDSNLTKSVSSAEVLGQVRQQPEQELLAKETCAHELQEIGCPQEVNRGKDMKNVHVKSGIRSNVSSPVSKSEVARDTTTDSAPSTQGSSSLSGVFESQSADSRALLTLAKDSRTFSRSAVTKERNGIHRKTSGIPNESELKDVSRKFLSDCQPKLSEGRRPSEANDSRTRYVTADSMVASKGGSVATMQTESMTDKLGKSSSSFSVKTVSMQSTEVSSPHIIDSDSRLHDENTLHLASGSVKGTEDSDDIKSRPFAYSASTSSVSKGKATNISRQTRSLDQSGKPAEETMQQGSSDQSQAMTNAESEGDVSTQMSAKAAVCMSTVSVSTPSSPLSATSVLTATAASTSSASIAVPSTGTQSGTIPSSPSVVDSHLKKSCLASDHRPVDHSSVTSSHSSADMPPAASSPSKELTALSGNSASGTLLDVAGTRKDQISHSSCVPSVEDTRAKNGHASGLRPKIPYVSLARLKDSTLRDLYAGKTVMVRSKSSVHQNSHKAFVHWDDQFQSDNHKRTVDTSADYRGDEDLPPGGSDTDETVLFGDEEDSLDDCCSPPVGVSRSYLERPIQPNQLQHDTIPQISTSQGHKKGTYQRRSQKSIRSPGLKHSSTQRARETVYPGTEINHNVHKSVKQDHRNSQRRFTCKDQPEKGPAMDTARAPCPALSGKQGHQQRNSVAVPKTSNAKTAVLESNKRQTAQLILHSPTVPKAKRKKQSWLPEGSEIKRNIASKGSRPSARDTDWTSLTHSQKTGKRPCIQLDAITLNKTLSIQIERIPDVTKRAVQERGKEIGDGPVKTGNVDKTAEENSGTSQERQHVGRSCSTVVTEALKRDSSVADKSRKRPSGRSVDKPKKQAKKPRMTAEKEVVLYPKTGRELQELFIPVHRLRKRPAIDPLLNVDQHAMKIISRANGNVHTLAEENVPLASDRSVESDGDCSNIQDHRATAASQSQHEISSPSTNSNTPGAEHTPSVRSATRERKISEESLENLTLPEIVKPRRARRKIRSEDFQAMTSDPDTEDRAVGSEALPLNRASSSPHRTGSSGDVHDAPCPAVHDSGVVLDARVHKPLPAALPSQQGSDGHVVSTEEGPDSEETGRHIRNNRIRSKEEDNSRRQFAEGTPLENMQTLQGKPSAAADYVTPNILPSCEMYAPSPSVTESAKNSEHQGKIDAMIAVDVDQNSTKKVNGENGATGSERISVDGQAHSSGRDSHAGSKEGQSRTPAPNGQVLQTQKGPGQQECKQPRETCVTSLCSDNDFTDDRAGCSGHGDIKNHVCGLCGATFRKTVEYLLHEESHANDSGHVKSSGETFESQKPLTMHDASHKEKAAVRCHICGKKFSGSQSLELHLHIHNHTYGTPYSCPQCPKTYRKSTLLVAHYRTHTGERPFKCLVCGKSYRFRQSLHAHRLTHTNKRPYKCFICDAAFSDSRARKVHQDTHGHCKPKAKHSCEYCFKMFAKKTDLTEHLRHNHTGQLCKLEEKKATSSNKRFHCISCGRGFSYRSTVRRHRKKFCVVVNGKSGGMK